MNRTEELIEKFAEIMTYGIDNGLPFPNGYSVEIESEAPILSSFLFVNNSLNESIKDTANLPQMFREVMLLKRQLYERNIYPYYFILRCIGKIYPLEYL